MTNIVVKHTIGEQKRLTPQESSIAVFDYIGGNVEKTTVYQVSWKAWNVRKYATEI